ncbi:hypothetical protein AQB9606_04161 [Aquabacterium sp. CECT 9606]|nr:hypothetical protein AQB9606_04161 [Aquabacterium sp. CECT 9606]
MKKGKGGAGLGITCFKPNPGLKKMLTTASKKSNK